MRAFKLLQAVAITFGFALAANAESIPFRFEDGLIWLKVSVAGAAAPLNFVLDSGAGATVISLDAARRSGLKLGSAENVSGVDGRSVARRVDGFCATVGDQALTHSVLALDLSAASAGCRQPIDGLIGADFFKRHVVQIDFAARCIRLPGAFEAGTGHADILPLKSINDAFCVAISVAGQAPQWVRLDTGCSDDLLWVAAPEHAKRHSPKAIALARSGGHCIATTVTLGSRTVDSVRTAVREHAIFPGESGLLGTGLLSKFRVTLDAKHHRVVLE